MYICEIEICNLLLRYERIEMVVRGASREHHPRSLTTLAICNVIQLAEIRSTISWMNYGNGYYYFILLLLTCNINTVNVTYETAKGYLWSLLLNVGDLILYCCCECHISYLCKNTGNWLVDHFTNVCLLLWAEYYTCLKLYCWYFA